MDGSKFVDQLVEAINTQDVKTLLHLCCDSSKRDDILKFTDDDGNRLIHLVASFGSIDLIRTLIEIGADVKEKNCDQKTVLHVASSYGNTKVVTYLLQADDDLKNDATICEKKDYKNMFYYAAKSGNIETVKSLQNIGHFDINKIFLNGSTTLLVLVKENDSKGVETLCRCGADVNVGSISMNRIEHGYKAIHVASEQYSSRNRHDRDVEMIRILLKYNANVNEPYITSESIMQPLFMVLRRNDVRNASVLLEHGADISFQGKLQKKQLEFIKRGANLYETHQNCSVLMIAIYSNAGSEVIEALVKAGADIKFGRNGKTVIQCCERYDQLKSFLTAGISVQDIESKHKVSTLGMAVATFTWDHFYYMTQSLDLKNEIADLISKGANLDMAIEGHDTPIIKAIKMNLLDVFEMLIAAGANIDKPGKDGNTAVHVSCIESNWKFLEILIESGADLNKANTRGDYPLELALSKSSSDKEGNVSKEDVITKMLDKGANPNSTARCKNSPLILAIKKRLDSIVEILLHKGADISHIGEHESTAFDICLRSALIDAGADVNKKDVDKFTAFDIFTEHFEMIMKCEQRQERREHFEMIMKCEQRQERRESAVALFKAFILAGIDVNQHNLFGTYPLFLAISLGMEELVTFMLENDADVNIVNGAGETSLTKVISHGFDNIVQLLLRFGANVNQFCKRSIVFYQENRRGYIHTYMQARDWISGNNDDHPEICLLLNLITNSQFPLEKRRNYVSSLLEFGADPNLEISGKDSCLMHAVKLGDSLLVKTLLNANADIKHVGDRGYTALHVFFLTKQSSASYKTQHEQTTTGNLEENCSSIFKTLLEYGAPTNIPSSDGDLPIHIAVSKCTKQCQFNENLAEIMTMIESNKNLMNIPDQNSFGVFLCKLIVVCSFIKRKKEFDKDVISFLLIHEADINAINDLEETPLITCTKRGSTYANVENITFLLANGADPNICAEGFNSAFLEAIKFDSFDVAFVLMDAKANINHIGKNGNSALHVIFSKEYLYESDESTSDDEYASSSDSSGNSREGAMYENNDYSIDDEYTGEKSGIHQKRINAKIKRILEETQHLQHFLDGNIDLWKEMQIFRYGDCKSQKLEILEALFSKKLNVNLQDNNGYTPLQLSIRNLKIDGTKKILSANPDMLLQRQNRLNEFDMCLMIDNENAVPIFECLLQLNARLNILDDMGKTVLKKAIDILCGKQSGNWAFLNGGNFTPAVSSFIQKMLQAGAIPTRNDLNGTLFVCSKNSDFKGMECLIRKGGDYCSTDENGIPFVHLGLSNKGYRYDYMEGDKFKSEIVAFLIKNGACCVKDTEGNGPLHIAAKNGYLTTLNVLLQSDIAKANVYEVVRRLLESHNSKLVCNFNRESVLYLSTVICRELKTCDVDVTSLTTQLVTTLLEYGIDPNNHLPDHIPLFAALKVGNVKTSTLLLEASANVNITNSSGKSGLHIVFESNRVTGKS
ncbi:unnamed protein product [Mytilus edulis]|uniref:Uncharacterized protein n=1 Tax=Mytilus edulis TaxID=6550 RepID=A0A8S3UWB2_MYTED|nr:unnamed protein product [Mytilus edulis]